MSEQQQGVSPASQGSLPRFVRTCRALRPVLGYIWGPIIGSIAIGTIANLNTTMTDTSLSKLYIIHLAQSFPVPVFSSLGILTLATLLVLIGSHSSSLAPLPPLSPHDRLYMLRRLQLRYEELLKQSLQGAVQLELSLASRPTGVQQAMSLALRLPEQADAPLPPHTSIVQAYTLAQQELLILGEPGSGKSTLLLELARYLVEQAFQDPTQPLPIFIPLSSWAQKRLPLQDWLIEQVAFLYDVHQDLSRQWLQAQHILPLLDGLDEMEESARPACIEAINAYHRGLLGHLRPLVVCSRADAYASASARQRLALHAAIIVQPLARGQVDAYLTTLGQPLAGLRATLKKNSLLQAIATTPLLLHVLMLTYYDTPIRRLPQKQARLRTQIWTNYVARMVARKGDEKCYPLHVTTTWLAWLAAQMRDRNQANFFLEDLQPDWLPKTQKLLYQWSVGILFGLGAVLFAELIWMLIYWVPFWFRGVAIFPIEGLLGTLPLALLEGVACGVFFGLRPIHLFETLTWSWATIRSRLLAGFFFGAGGSVLIMLPIGLKTKSSPKQLAERVSYAPNEGIRRSAKNGIHNGLVLAPFAGLFTGLFAFFHAEAYAGIGLALVLGLLQIVFSGLLYGAILGLISGLGAFFQHYILRFWLACSGIFPWRAVPFLEDATTRMLLQRVGGGYRFTHRLLLEYFANLTTKRS